MTILNKSAHLRDKARVIIHRMSSSRQVKKLTAASRRGLSGPRRAIIFVSTPAPRPEADSKVRLLQSLITRQSKLVMAGISPTFDKSRFVRLMANSRQIIDLIEESDIVVTQEVNPIAISDLTLLNSEISRLITNGQRLRMAEMVKDPGLEDAKKLSVRLTSGKARVLTHDETERSVQEYRKARDAMRNRQPALPRPNTP